MTEQLPISIYVCDDLIKQLVNINSITNKLAAQFNFQAMTANWYGDEYSILFIQLRLETPQRLVNLQEKQKENQLTKRLQNFEMHSDDVFSYIDDQEPQQLICTIAITEQEQTLLDQHSTLLSALLTLKLKKTLNIIAKQLSLKPI